MTLRELTESANDTVMYHVSPRRNRASIKRTGLDPRIQEFTNIQRRPGVFLLQTLEQAQDWAFWHSLTYMERTDIWQIAVPEHAELQPDPSEEMDIYNSWVTYMRIPPQNLKVVGEQKIPRSTEEAPPSPAKIHD